MKSYLLFVIALFLNSSLLFAQANRSIRVKAGEDVAQAYSPYGFYRFQQFNMATIYFKAGTQNAGHLFNYNILYNNLQFIGPGGDTLDLMGVENIDSAVINDNVFYYKDGLIEKVAMAQPVALLKKTVITTNIENIGAYGLASSTAAIDNINSYTFGKVVYNMVLNQDIVVTENTSWFFANGNNNLLKANKENFLKLLPAEKQTKAAAYLKQNKTNFAKEKDLKKLLEAVRS